MCPSTICKTKLAQPSYDLFLNIWPFTLTKVISTTGDNSGAGTAYSSTAHDFTPSFVWAACYPIFCFICMRCRLLLVLLYFFFCPLCCLFFFFDIWILITSLWYLQTLRIRINNISQRNTSSKMQHMCNTTL